MPITRTKRPRSRLARLLTAGALALLGHGLVGVYLAVSGALSNLSPAAMPLVDARDTRDSASDEPMTVESLVDELERPLSETPQERKVEKEVNEKNPKGQVVDIAQPSIEQRPDEAKFVSEYDSTVARETKGPTGKTTAGAATPGAVVTPKAEPAPRAIPLPASSHPPTHEKALLAMRDPSRTTAPGPTGTKSELREAGPDGDQPHPGGQNPLRPDVRGGGTPPAGGPSANLKPSTAVLQQALGQGAGSPDYLHDMDEADATGLNTKKWKFAAFFNRMKRLVQGEWHPDQLLSRHDPSGRIYGSKDRVSVLRVELKLDGRVQDVSVKQSSGVEFLDEEAMSAFRRAQPFENAPQPLADPDGVIRFNFAFIVQLSGQTSFKVYRE